jgi:hypothetical protein
MYWFNKPSILVQLGMLQPWSLSLHAACLTTTSWIIPRDVSLGRWSFFYVTGFGCLHFFVIISSREIDHHFLFFCLFCFWWFWSLNSGLCACRQALYCLSSHFLFLVISWVLYQSYAYLVSWVKRVFSFLRSMQFYYNISVVLFS